MQSYIFGYGSLINLESASRTLKRPINLSDVIPCTLRGFQRNWTLWDNAYSEQLEQEVRAVFLNISPDESALLNGIIFAISEPELAYFITREKNYDCTDVTEQIAFASPGLLPDIEKRIITFVGKAEHLIFLPADDTVIFSRYQQIVSDGIAAFGPLFVENFYRLTVPPVFRIVAGAYRFVHPDQQKAR